MKVIYDFLANNYIIFMILSIFIFFVLIGNIITMIRNRKKEDNLQPIDMEKVNNEAKSKEELEMEKLANENTLNTRSGTFNPNSIVNEPKGEAPSLDQFENAGTPTSVNIPILNELSQQNQANQMNQVKQMNRPVQAMKPQQMVNPNMMNQKQVNIQKNPSVNPLGESTVVSGVTTSSSFESVSLGEDSGMTIENVFVIDDKSSDDGASNIPTSKNPNRNF